MLRKLMSISLQPNETIFHYANEAEGFTNEEHFDGITEDLNTKKTLQSVQVEST